MSTSLSESERRFGGLPCTQLACRLRALRVSRCIPSTLQRLLCVRLTTRKHDTLVDDEVSKRLVRLFKQTPFSDASPFPYRNDDFGGAVTTTARREAPSVFDSFFGIRIAAPKMTLEVFNSFCAELQRVKLSSLCGSRGNGDTETITSAVIVESTGMRESSSRF